MILLTLPYAEVKKALTPVRQYLARKVVVDVTNPITPDHKSLVIGHTTSGAEEIARLLDESYFVKALNTVFAEVYAGQDSRIDEQTISVFSPVTTPTQKTK